jgi:hypothetical protein
MCVSNLLGFSGKSYQGGDFFMACREYGRIVSLPFPSRLWPVKEEPASFRPTLDRGQEVRR